MTQPTQPSAVAPTPQVPLAQAVASLGAPPAAQNPVPAPAIPPTPTPFTVILVDTAKTEHPVIVISAKLGIVKAGTSPTAGSIVLRAQLLGTINGLSLLAIANIQGAYSLVIRYTAPNGTVLRDDTIEVQPTSHVVDHGPELAETEKGWEFFETLTINA